MDAIAKSYTPGPWYVETYGSVEGGYHVCQSSDAATDGCGVNVVYVPPKRRAVTGVIYCIEDANLIAAAPKMLDELDECRKFLEDMHCQPVENTVAESQVRLRAVIAAIARATGATP